MGEPFQHQEGRAARRLEYGGRVRVGVDGLEGDLGGAQILSGDLLDQPEDIGVLQVGAEESGADVHRDVGEVEGEREAAEPAQPLDVEDIGVGGDAQPVGDAGGGGDGADGPYLIGDRAVFVQGLGKAHQPVQTVRVLLRHDDRAHPGQPLHQPLGAQQIEGQAHGVAGGAAVRAERVLKRQYAPGEAAGQDLVAEQIGELPRPVGAEPAAVCGGDRRGVLTDAFAGAFGWHRPAPGVLGGGSCPDHTDGALRWCCRSVAPLDEGSGAARACSFVLAAARSATTRSAVRRAPRRARQGARESGVGGRAP